MNTVTLRGRETVLDDLAQEILALRTRHHQLTRGTEAELRLALAPYIGTFVTHVPYELVESDPGNLRSQKHPSSYHITDTDLTQRGGHGKKYFVFGDVDTINGAGLVRIEGVEGLTDFHEGTVPGSRQAFLHLTETKAPIDIYTPGPREFAGSWKPTRRHTYFSYAPGMMLIERANRTRSPPQDNPDIPFTMSFIGHVLIRLPIAPK